MLPVLYIIVPCYNEEMVLPLMAPRFSDKLRRLWEKGMISDKSRVLFVNDGSTDGTWRLIEEFAAADSRILGMALSRNRGHQNALLAGLMTARDLCDITISIDCDGQDDMEAMDEMLKAWQEGCEIVYGVRSDRESDTWFKRTSAQGFYRFLSFLGVETVYNHADYRLIGSRALDALAEFGEVNLYLRGMVPLVGFKSTAVPYKRTERLAGQSHYPLRKMLALAMDGITSMSTRPIAFITRLGFMIVLISLVGIAYALISLAMGRAVSGWASMTCIICFLGGIQLLSLSIIGEYIGKLYLEAKHRPRYIIADRTWEKNEDPLRGHLNGTEG